MVPVFSAFDHLTYRKLISEHLHVLSLPQSILDFFRIGGFIVSLPANPWHSVAIDEAHKMKINKECKMSGSTVRRLHQKNRRIHSISGKMYGESKTTASYKCFELDTSSPVSLLTKS